MPSTANTCVIRVPPANISGITPGRFGSYIVTLAGHVVGANTLMLAGGTPNYSRCIEIFYQVADIHGEERWRFMILVTD